MLQEQCRECGKCEVRSKTQPGWIQRVPWALCRLFNIDLLSLSRALGDNETLQGTVVG